METAALSARRLPESGSISEQPQIYEPQIKHALHCLSINCIYSVFKMEPGQEFQPTNPRGSIRDLSSELIYMIMDHLPYLTQFDLARTCRRLAFASRGVLERHQNYYTKYRVASDLDPSTVPLLLRSAFGEGDPIPAWHVRSFEVWKDRSTWSDWQKFDLRTPLVSGEDDEPSELRVSKDDARRYLYWFEEQRGEDLGPDLIETLLDQVNSGQDGLLTALLFAKLEYLEDLKFVTRSQEEGSCLASMKTLLAECIEEDTNDAWPIGFRGIQRMAVGVASGTWMDDNRDQEPCIQLFAYFLRLPTLNSIYFNGLCAYEADSDMDEDLEEEIWDSSILLADSSSVKHIFLDDCRGTFGDEDEYLWAAPRQLLTMSIRLRGCCNFDHSTSMSSRVAHLQKDSLRSLMWYGCTNGNIFGDHCTILDNEEFDHLKSLSDIRHMTVCMNDIYLGVEHAKIYNDLKPFPKDRDEEDDEGNIFKEKNHDRFTIRWIATLFPRTMETLVLWDRADENMVRLIECGLIRMIQSGRYTNLKAIFLEPMERATRHLGKGDLCFQDAIAAGKEAGVDIYTLSNQGGMQHPIEFAEAPDEHDLHSGIYAGVRPGYWVFDPYLGRRISPSCKAERYDALWAKLKAENEACLRRNGMMDDD